MNPVDLPSDEFLRDRAARRERATRRITQFNRIWLAAQLAALPLGAAGFVFLVWESWLGPFGGFGFFAFTALAWAISTAAAGASSWITFWNWPLLPGVWRTVGLAPWAVLLSEVTFVALGVA